MGEVSEATMTGVELMDGLRHLLDGWDATLQSCEWDTAKDGLVRVRFSFRFDPNDDAPSPPRAAA